LPFAGALATWALRIIATILVACNRPLGRRDALEAWPRANQPFDTSVILLDDVVQQLHLSLFGETP
jgi:hypothetical protein